MIGVLSDAHGNRPAFDAAIRALSLAGATRFVFLGDAVGYLPSRSVVDAIAGLGESIMCVRGNHDSMVLSDTIDIAREDAYQHQAIRALLTPGDCELIAGWPLQWAEAWPAGRALFVHGSPANPTNGYVYPDTDLDTVATDADFVFMGHTHRPFVRAHRDKVFVNAGSCGLPRDDGWMGAAALFDERDGHAQIVRFDIEQQTREWLEMIPRVHESVMAALARRPDKVHGR